ncbi:hypothetical protein C0991_002214, partial [Blastosporella zonata]
MGAESKAALITPSASPPHTRPFSQPPYRIKDHASPTKRQRLSSAPRQIQQHATEPVDVRSGLKDSQQRLFAHWDGLVRHAKPMNKDDIVDITTGKIVQDRGVIRGSQIFHFGTFVGLVPDDADDELEEVDEDIDELVSFANGGIGSEDDRIHALQAAEMDERDAEDLREFLEAEKRINGGHVDETEGSVYESQAEDDAYKEDSEPVAVPYFKPAAKAKASPFDNSDGGETPPPPPEPFYVDSGSDDELGGWDHAEASVVYRVSKEDSDSEIEFLDRTTPPTKAPLGATDLSPEVPLPSWTSPEPVTPRKVSKRASFPTQRQLQTPPQSHASSQLSETPDDYLDHAPPPTSSPPRSSSPLSSQYPSSPIKNSQAAKEPGKPMSERKRTLQPRTHLTDPAHPIPRLDLTKILEPRAKRPLSRAPLTETAGAGSYRSEPDYTKAKKVTPMTSASRAKPTSAKQLATDVEVVLSRRTPFHDTPLGDVAPPKESAKPRLIAKSQGKQKATSSDKQIESLEDDIVAEEHPSQRSPSPKARKGDKASEPPP